MYNPVTKNLENILNDNLHMLYCDPDRKKVLVEGTISVTYRIGKCLKELISPSLYLRTVTESASRISKCNESRCDILKLNSLVLLQVRHITLEVI